MTLNRFIVFFATVVMSLTGPGVQFCHAANPAKEFAEKLQETYKLTKVGLLLGDLRSGSIVVLQRDDILGNPDIPQSGPFGTTHSIAVSNRMQSDDKVQYMSHGSFSKSFHAGDRFYVIDIDNWSSTGIEFTLLSVDTYPVTIEGTSRQLRYIAEIVVNFKKGSLDTATIDDFKPVFDKVFKLDSDVKNAPARTVELGQTPEQVEGILGKPDNVINLGPKQMYIYKNMKVIFQDGKVSDVQ